MNIEEIREIARQHQINPEGLSQMDLIRAIQGNEGNVNCFGTSYVDQCGQYECLWREDCLAGGASARRDPSGFQLI